MLNVTIFQGRIANDVVQEQTKSNTPPVPPAGSCRSGLSDQWREKNRFSVLRCMAGHGHFRRKVFLQRRCSYRPWSSGGKRLD